MTPVGYLETGVIYCDDNLRRLSQFPAECIDLVYLDPPFFSNRKYEVIWGDEAEVRSFEDRWEGGIHVYIEWMRERVLELHRLLKPTGTLYLHCDWHASHYLKVMLDDVFGRENFLNEIVWRYRRWPSKQKNFQRMHDTIFRYSKTRDVAWNQLYEPLSEQTAKRIPGGGRIVTTLDDFGKKRIRETGEQSKGVPMSDVWEIPQIVGPTAERLGWPTQKPEALLRRIIEASSNPKDIVLDPFCGCGTTLVAAQQLGRQWVGIDISPTSVDIMERRLVKLGATVRTEGMPVTEEELRVLKPYEFQNWVINRINGTHSPRKSGDMGIDGYSWLAHEPIQVKQSDHVGRNVVDNFETAMERFGVKRKGYIIAFSFGRGAREEVARAKAAKKLDIELVTVKQLADRSHPLTQQAGDIFGVQPIPTRNAETLPTLEDLIAGDVGSDTA